MDSNLLLMGSNEGSLPTESVEKAIVEDINEGINTVSCTELTPDPFYGYVEFNLKADQVIKDSNSIADFYGTGTTGSTYKNGINSTSLTYPDLSILDEKNSPFCFSYQLGTDFKNSALESFIDDCVYRHKRIIDKSETMARAAIPATDNANRKSIKTLLNQADLNLKSIHFLVVFKATEIVSNGRLFLFNNNVSPSQGFVITTDASGKLFLANNTNNMWSAGNYFSYVPIKINNWYALKISINLTTLTFEIADLGDNKSISIYKNTDYSPTIKVNYNDPNYYTNLPQIPSTIKSILTTAHVSYFPNWNTFAIGNATLNCKWSSESIGTSNYRFVGNISVGFLATHLDINDVSIYDMLVGDTLGKQCSIPNLTNPARSGNSISGFTSLISSKAINPYPITYHPDFYKTFYSCLLGDTTTPPEYNTASTIVKNLKSYTSITYFCDLLLSNTNVSVIIPRKYLIKFIIKNPADSKEYIIAFQHDYTVTDVTSKLFVSFDAANPNSLKYLVFDEIFLNHLAAPTLYATPTLLPTRIGFSVNDTEITLIFSIFNGKNYVSSLSQTKKFDFATYPDLTIFKNIPDAATVSVKIVTQGGVLINSFGVVGHKDGDSFYTNASDSLTTLKYKQFYYKNGVKSSYIAPAELSNIDPIFNDILVGCRYKPIVKETTNNIDIMGKNAFLSASEGAAPVYLFNSLSNVVKIADVGIPQLFNNKKAFKFTSSGQALKLDNHSYNQKGCQFSNSPFCLEFFIYPTYPYMYDSFGKGDAATVSGTSVSGYFHTSWEFYTSTGTYTLPLKTDIPTNKWTHFALVRVKDVTAGTDHIRVFYDGVQFGSGLAITSATALNNAIYPISIGQYAGAGYSGYIDEIRLTLGASRYYTTSFTPPTQTLSY